VLSLTLLDGPMPTDQAIERCEQLVATTPGPGRATPLKYRAELLAARERFDDAREALQEARAIAESMGAPMAVALYRWTEGAIEALAGRWEAAEAALRPLHARLVETDEGWAIAGIGSLLAEVLLEQDRPAEAREQVTQARAHAAPRSTYYQAWWRRALARVEAREGHMQAAESLSREALSLIDQSDWLYFRAETELALADVLRRAGNEAPALEAANRALALCAAKHHLAGIRRAQAFLTSEDRDHFASRDSLP